MNNNKWDKFNEGGFLIIKNGKKCGTIRTRYTTSGVCHVSLQFFSFAFDNDTYYEGHGRAGGYGYDKLSSAMYDALKNAYNEDSTYDSELRRTTKYINRDLTNIIPVEPGTGNYGFAFKVAGFELWSV